MQTTLLGIAIALILALATALAGPLLVDWSQYRSAFEAEATRLVGAPVRVEGAIDLRLLPTPILHVRDVSVGANRQAPGLKVSHLGVELGLGGLMRGEVKATRLDIERPEVWLGLDANGKLDVPSLAMSFDPDALAIEHLKIENARAVISDAATGGSFTLDEFSFNGDVRSLAGPFKGEGGFTSAGQVYGYRVAASRRGDDGGMKLRFGLDPVDRPLTVESDGTFFVESGAPRYEGGVTLTRPAGMVLQNGRPLSGDPWRITSKVKTTAGAALFEGAELQYGTEDRMVRLAGTADLRFRPKPRLDAVVSARQLDLDRLVSTDGVKRPPIAVLQAFADRFADTVTLPFPLKVGVGIDSLTMSGAALQSVRGDFSSAADALAIETLEFRAPGSTQIRVSGRLRTAAKTLEFSGPASVNSFDPKALLAWVEGNADVGRASIGASIIGPLAGRGDVTLGSERIAVDRLRAEVDRKTFEGRLAYDYPSQGKPARIDAALSAAELDVDRAIAFTRSAFAGTSFEWPGEIALSLKVAKASIWGVEAKSADANLKYDASGLVIDRLSIADIGGATLRGSGRIDTAAAWTSPRGALNFSLEATRLDGLRALAANLAPDAADTLLSLAPRLAPAKIDAVVEVSPLPGSAGATSSPMSQAVVKLEGRAGAFRLKFDASGQGEASAWRSADGRLRGRLDADDGGPLSQLLGLEPFAAVDRGPASVVVAASGRPDGDVRVDARFAGAGLDAGAIGTLQIANVGMRGALDIDVNATRAKLPRRDAPMTLPLYLKTRLTVADRQFTFSDVTGKVAGVDVKGRVSLLPGRPARIDGHLEVADLDASALLSAATGLGGNPGSNAARRGPRRTGWSPEPFSLSPFLDLDGFMDIAATSATVSPTLSARQVKGVVRFEPAGLAFEDVEAVIAGGKLSGALRFGTGAAGLTMNARMKLAGGDIAVLLGTGGKSPLGGRANLDLNAEGVGLSAAALIGDLRGNGTISIDNAQVSGLEPHAIDGVIRAVDRGLQIEQNKVTDFISGALDAAPLRLPSVGGNVALSGGRFYVARLPAVIDGADLALTGSYDLASESLDARVSMVGPPHPDAPGGQRAEVTVAFNGPLGASRRSIDASPLMTWLTLRAVEQEQKRLEIAEAEAKRLAALESERRAKFDRERQERDNLERDKVERDRLERERVDRERADAAAAGASAAQRAPDLPPPIDVKPATVTPSRPRAPQPRQQQHQPIEAPAASSLPSFPFFQIR